MTDTADADHTSPVLEERGPWRVLGRREVYANHWIRVREDQVIQPDGQPGIYGVVEFHPAVGIVALTDDRQVYLIGQHRYPLDEYSWEIITGFAEHGEDMLAAAQRELREEAGLTATRWTTLGRCHISNGVTDQVGYLFLATDLNETAGEPDATEALTVQKVPFDVAIRMATESAIVQAFSIVGLYRAAQARQRRTLSDGLPLGTEGNAHWSRDELHER